MMPTTLPARYQRGFAWKINQSSKLGRDLSATLAGLAAHLGGAESVSLIEVLQSERLAFLERRLCDHESAVLKGLPPLLTEGEYTAALAQFVGLCKSLGPHRKARNVSLADYLRKQSERPATPTTRPVKASGEGSP